MCRVEAYASDIGMPRSCAYDPSYVDSDMLGVNQNVRKTPVTSSTVNDQSAISPSMNDQWSGNTLRRYVRPSLPTPVRSSIQAATAEVLAAIRALRPHGSSPLR